MKDALVFAKIEMCKRHHDLGTLLPQLIREFCCKLGAALLAINWWVGFVVSQVNSQPEQTDFDSTCLDDGGRNHFFGDQQRRWCASIEMHICPDPREVGFGHPLPKNLRMLAI